MVPRPDRRGRTLRRGGIRPGAAAAEAGDAVCVGFASLEDDMFTYPCHTGRSSEQAQDTLNQRAWTRRDFR